MEARVAVLEQIATSTEKVLERLEKRLERVDTRFDRMDDRMDRIENRQIADFRIMFAALITATLGLAGLMAHGFKWL